MNYIAAFLFEFTLNEEDSFYYFYGILKYTQFSDLFLNDLIKLKQFFYILDRLIFIYMPELSIYFKNLGILTNYFSSSWFITLFTNSYQFITDTKNPKILIFILDNFILVNFLFNILERMEDNIKNMPMFN